MPAGVDEAAFREYLKSPIAFPPAFKDWMSDWYATNVPKLHVSQIFGFKLHSIYVADDVAGTDTISATAYGDPGTPGPTLPNIANGFYVVMWGCYADLLGSTDTLYMSVSVNGDTPSGQMEMLIGSTEAAYSVGRLALVDLSQGDQANTLKAVYKKGSVGGSVSFRWLHALRVVTDDG